jgi:hypothetical protein
VPAGEPSKRDFEESYARFCDLYARLAGWFEPSAAAQSSVHLVS